MRKACGLAEIRLSGKCSLCWGRGRLNLSTTWPGHLIGRWGGPRFSPTDILIYFYSQVRPITVFMNVFVELWIAVCSAAALLLILISTYEQEGSGFTTNLEVPGDGLPHLSREGEGDYECVWDCFGTFASYLFWIMKNYSWWAKCVHEQRTCMRLENCIRIDATDVKPVSG